MIKLFTVFFLLLILSCGQSPPKQTSADNGKIIDSLWNTFEDSNYSFRYPSTWKLNQSGELGASFILFSPLESKDDHFKENVNLLFQNLPQENFDLDKYMEISLEQIKTMTTNFTLIENKRIKTKSEEHQILIYSGDQGEFHFQFEQFYWIKNNKVFVLTLTCEKNKFLKYKEVGEKILNSFRIKD